MELDDVAEDEEVEVQEDEAEIELVELAIVELLEVDVVEEVEMDEEELELLVEDAVLEVEDVVVVVDEDVTSNGAEAWTPDGIAVARTVWTPDDVDGTMNAVVNAPWVLVAKLPTWTPSKAITPFDSAVKFAPTTRTLDPAGPKMGTSTIVADADDVDAIEEDRITINANRRSIDPTRFVLRSGLVGRS